ncbi:MAG: phasin family protein [Pseudomonadota bacterium]
MAAAKKATKKTTKTTAKSAAQKTRRAAKKTVQHAAETIEEVRDDAQTDLQSIMNRIRNGFGDAATALSETGDKLDDTRRDVMLAIIESAQENADHTFAALREIMDSETVGETLRIQRDAMRETIERNVAQVREISSLAAQGGRGSIEPLGSYITELRKGENA